MSSKEDELIARTYNLDLNNERKKVENLRNIRKARRETNVKKKNVNNNNFKLKDYPVNLNSVLFSAI